MAKAGPWNGSARLLQILHRRSGLSYSDVSTVLSHQESETGEANHATHHTQTTEENDGP